MQELKVLKDKAKKAGKKAKDEYKALEATMVARHAQELVQFDNPPDIKFPDSMYGDLSSDKVCCGAVRHCH